MNRTALDHRATTDRSRGFALSAAGTAILTAIGGALLAGPAAADSPTTDSFSYTGGTQTWTVPDGVTSATFTLDGASGGTGGASAPRPQQGRAANWSPRSPSPRATSTRS